MSIISIVVPVYNAGKSLKRCLESLVQQSYKELEIILVDDGSTDGSAEICDDYAKQDSRVCVIHKKNAGVSAARNTGIEQATGTYLQFVDSDDYLDLDACEILVDAMEKNRSEMVICGYVEHEREEQKVVQYKQIVLQSIKELSRDFGKLYRTNLLNIPWNKLFYRDKIKDRFDEAISLGEDLLFNINYMKQIEKIAIINATPYHYIIGSASLSRVFRKDSMDVACLLQKKVSDFAKLKLDHSYEQEKINGVFALSFYRCSGLLVRDEKLTAREKKLYLKKWLKDEHIVTIIKNAESIGVKEKVMQKIVQLKLNNVLYYLLKLKAKLSR